MARSTRSQRSVNGESACLRRRALVPPAGLRQNRSTSPTVIDSGALGEQVSALGAAARFDKSALLQTGQNQLQKLLRNLLPAGDFGDLHGLRAGVGRQIENGLKGILALDRNVHGRNAPINSPAKLEISGFAPIRQHDGISTEKQHWATWMDAKTAGREKRKG